MTRLPRRDLGVVLFLAVLTALFYFPLTFQGRVIADFDALTYFYPHAIYLAERLRAGQIPLWDPLEFTGVPFLANSQVGALYPLSLLYLLGPVSRIYAILLVGHIWFLSVGCYLLARISLGLSRPAATFSAVAITFGGFVGGMVGHLNQVEALAWAPFAILLVERVAARASWRYAFWATVPFAWCVMAGHSQVLFFTGLLAGFAGAARLLQRRCALSVSGWARLAVGPFLGALMCSAQLLPTLELARVSIRSTGLDFADASAFSLPPIYLLTSLFPTINQPLPTDEWLGYLGLTTLILAVLGLVLRPRAEAIALGVLALIGLILAFGRYTPVYELIFHYVPGVGLFRVPARWLTFWLFAVGLLAGLGVDALRDPAPVWRHWGRQWIGVTSLIGIGAGAALVAEVMKYRALIAWPSLSTLVLWSSTALVVGIIIVAERRRRTGYAGLALLVVLVGELTVAGRGLPIQNAIPINGVEVDRSTDQFLVNQRSPDRVMALGDNTYDPGDLKALRASVQDFLSPTAEAQFITAIKHTEGLTPNLFERFGLASIDGYDGGVLPLARYAYFKQLFRVEGPVVSDGRLRLQLVSAPSAKLLGWLNVRYLLMDRLRDHWVDGVYYDFAVSAEIPSGGSVDLATSPPFPYNRLGVILSGNPGGPPIGVLTVHAGESTLKLDLQNPGVRAAGRFMKDNFDPNGAWLWILDAPALDSVTGVTVGWTGDGPARLRSLSAFDTQTSTDRTITTSRSYRVQYLADMKIYQNRDVLPRAFLSRGIEVVPRLSAAVDTMRGSGWDPQSIAVAVAGDVPSNLAFAASGPAGTTTMVEQKPERVVVDSQATGQRVLVLTDAYYPGWQATIDGVTAPIYEVNVMFRGVVVPAGRHQVVFSYSPLSWRIGLIGSAAGIATLGLGLFLTRGRGEKRSD